MENVQWHRTYYLGSLEALKLILTALSQTLAQYFSKCALNVLYDIQQSLVLLPFDPTEIEPKVPPVI